MNFARNKVRSVATNEDRLSSLPDELIHRILSRIDDTKFVVQTCLLSSRWKFLWTSVSCLNFSSWQFSTLVKFTQFVTHVLSHRNHQIEVSSVKLNFHGAASQVFVQEIASYVFSHNVQELTVLSCPQNRHGFPLCLFSSHTLKRFTFTFSSPFLNPCLTPKTPWEFPALTTLHLSEITLCEDNRECIDLFSKCVNLEDLTLNGFIVEAKAFDITAPRLANLMLINGRRSNAINLIAPQLKNLTIIDCSLKSFNAPPGLSSFVYRGDHPPQWFKGCFCSINKVSVCLSFHGLDMPYSEQDAHETINMLQELHNARFITLNMEIVECLSSFPDLLSLNRSLFSNLICLNIDSSMREKADKVEISTEVGNFFLENSPGATIVKELPKELPIKETKAKKAKFVADMEIRMLELQASLEQENIFVERNQAIEKNKVAVENLKTELQVWSKKKVIEKSEQEKAQNREVVEGIVSQMKCCMGKIEDIVKQEYEDVQAIVSKVGWVRLILENLSKQQMTKIVECCSRHLLELVTLCARIRLEMHSTMEIVRDIYIYLATIKDVSTCIDHPASQPSSSAIGR